MFTNVTNPNNLTVCLPIYSEDIARAIAEFDGVLVFWTVKSRTNETTCVGPSPTAVKWWLE